MTMTGEELARELSTLKGRPMSEIQTEGTQATLVATHLTGMIPTGRIYLNRLALGESFVRPSENADPHRRMGMHLALCRLMPLWAPLPRMLH